MPRSAGRPMRGMSVVVAFVALLAAAGLLAFAANTTVNARRTEARNSWRDRLEEISSQRATLVSAWVAESLRDAMTVAAFPSVLELLTMDPAEGKVRAGIEAHVLELLANYIGQQHFASVEIADAAGRPLLRAGAPTDTAGFASVHRRVVATGRPVVDILASASSQSVVFAVPCRRRSDEPLAGSLYLVVEPSEWLYPELLREPVPTTTAENLLLGIAEGRAALLSPGRHRATVGVRPFSDAGFDGEDGWRPRTYDGLTDYRGVKVMAAVRPVPGTTWAIASKVDHDQVLRPADRRAWQGIGSWSAVLLAAAGLIFGLWRQRQARFVSQQLASAEQIGFLNRLLRTISEVHALIIRERDGQRLLDGTCRIIVEHGGFQMAWVAVADAQHKVTPVAASGHVDGYLESLPFRSDDSPEGRGPTGTAIRERRPVVVPDVEASPEMALWREGALARGYRSTAAFPLVCGGHVYGALTVHASEPGVLRDEAAELLASLALDVAYAIQVLDNERAHEATVKDREQLAEQLQQAQKMEAVGRLAGGVAHDFNNLLTAITGYAELALMESTEPERCRHDIEEVRKAAERASGLTRQLLAFSRKQVLQPRVLDLNEVVRDVEKMLRRMIGENIEFGLSLTPQIGRVKADPGQLEQVLMNLAVNARDAMPSGGRVLIETSNVHVTAASRPHAELQPGRYVTLAFRDTGAGIPPEVLPHIFEPFFTTKERGKGTGLGLSTVYGIVKQSGGAITVESEPGRGTVFTSYFRREDSPAEAIGTADNQVAVTRGRGETVLVVEDNEGVRHLVREALGRSGYRVILAASAEEALRLLRELGRVDLLLTDVVLPRMTGPELARTATANRPDLKVLYMSGYTDAAIAPGTIDIDRDLVSKPFTPTEIAARVGTALEPRSPTA